jgi:GNAT superfamily N-acetyltransferase
MTSNDDLARRVDAAQSILESPAAEQARRLERAVAESSGDVARAMARLDPASGASVRAIAGGLAIFAGAGSPLTQGLGIGLAGPVTAADIDALEAHVAPSGSGSKQLEICPFVDPTLPSILAARGYAVHEWQLAWTCPIDRARLEPAQPPDASLRIRPIARGEEDLFFRTVMAGFLETDDVPDDAIALMRPSAFTDRHELFLAFAGDTPIGGGSLAWRDGIALINGSGVRPTFRRRGAQGALLRARLARAAELGCAIAYSATLPGTASRRNMQRHGFEVAYPKLVMLKTG